MRNLIAAVVGSVVLAAAGFAAASITKGPPGGVGAQTVTGATTGILTGTTPARKQTICHKTHSKTNPGVTITVSQNALPAHMAHGDHLGPCTAAELKAGKQTQTTAKPTKAKTKAKTKSKATAKTKAKAKSKTTHKPKKASKPKTHGKPSTTGKPSHPGKPSNPGKGHNP